MDNEESPIDLLLFNNNTNKRQTVLMGSLMTSSLANTSNSGSSNTIMNVILPLKNIIKTRELTKFDIASENEQDKKPVNAEEDHKKTN